MCPDGWIFSPASEFSCQTAGGNPDGYVRLEDAIAINSFALAPQEFLGDWSSFDGTGFFSFDHKIFQTCGGPANPYYVRIRGSGRPLHTGTSL